MHSLVEMYHRLGSDPTIMLIIIFSVNIFDQIKSTALSLLLQFNETFDTFHSEVSHLYTFWLLFNICCFLKISSFVVRKKKRDYSWITLTTLITMVLENQNF